MNSSGEQLAPPGERPRSKGTRRRLLSAATELLAEVGWGRVTTRAVAERAELPLGAVSYHFRGKQEMLMQATLEALEGIFPMTELAAVETLPDLSTLMRASVGHGDSFDPVLSAVLVETMREARHNPALQERIATLLAEYRRLLTELVRTEQQRGSVAANMDPAALATLIAAAGDGLLLHALLDVELDVVAATMNLFALLASGRSQRGAWAMKEPSQRGTDSPSPPPPGGRQWVMVVLLTLASFLVILNAAALPIPLPSIMEDLGGTLDEVTWVLAAYIVVFAALLLPCARLGDVRGRRRLFLAGIVLFTVASLACAMAPSIGFLIGAQAALGAGAAMVEPAIFATIKTALPRQLHGRAYGVQSAGFFAGGALGPLLSGAVTTGLSWQFIFWLNTLAGTVVLAGAVLVMPESRAEDSARGLDVPGFVFGAVGVAALMVAVIEGARLGWSSPLIVGLFATAAVALTLFTAAEACTRQPLVDLALFRYRLFAVGNVVRATTEFVSLGIFFALSHFLQVQLGYSALVTGALLMTVIAAALLTAPVAESLTGRVDVRWLVLPGFALVAIGTFWAAHVWTGASWAFLLAPLALFGIGIGALESPTDTVTKADLPAAQWESAWRVGYTTYLLGIGLGVAVVSAVWQSQLVTAAPDTAVWHGVPATVGDPAAFADAVNTALLSCVAAALLGAAVAVFFSSNRHDGVWGGSRQD